MDQIIKSIQQIIYTQQWSINIILILFILFQLLSSLDRYKDVDIMCNDEPLYKDHTLKFVYVTRWRTKEPPMKLHYIPKVNINILGQILNEQYKSPTQ